MLSAVGMNSWADSGGLHRPGANAGPKLIILVVVSALDVSTKAEVGNIFSTFRTGWMCLQLISRDIAVAERISRWVAVGYMAISSRSGLGLKCERMPIPTN